MQWLKDFLNDFFTNLYDAFQWTLEAVAELIKYLAFTVYDGLLSVIYTFASAVDLSEVAFNMAAEYSGLPTQLKWLIAEVNLPQGMTYISGAIIVRMVINIIPAAATRI